MRARSLQVTAVLAVAVVAAVSAQDAIPPVRFVTHRLGQFRSEACGVADFDGDGHLDISAGPDLYLGPDWRKIHIRPVSGEVDDKGMGYCDDFANLPLDVDADGKTDIVSCGWFSQRIAWHRNTLGEPGDWPEEALELAANFECADLVDIDGDGQPNEILPHTPQTVWVEAANLAEGRRGLVAHVISAKPLNFGCGAGDISGDGRPDVLRPEAWFEAPADPRAGDWVEHTWALGGMDGAVDHTPQILVYDVNGDGLNDIVTSNAHKYGIFWYEQRREGGTMAWVQHLIDESWSQPHSLALADIDGDGDRDLVTGKRFMAHNGSDPDEFGPLGVYWYELSGGAAPEWTKHVISYDEGIGSGVGLCVVDMDQDGDSDVVVTGKWGGPVLFENIGE